MKQTFYCMLTVVFIAVILMGCKKQASQERGMFTGEWAFAEANLFPDDTLETFMSTDYYAKLNLYEKKEIGDGYPQCYGLYVTTNEVNQTELVIDSILYLSADSAVTLASNFDYPEDSQIKLKFKYNEKDNSLIVYLTRGGEFVSKEILPRYHGKNE